MAGLSMNVGGFGGIASGPSPSYGSAASYGSAHEAAFGPGATVDAPSAAVALGASTAAPGPKAASCADPYDAAEP